jgi:hypothetical protein
LTLSNATCVKAEIPPGKISLASAVFQKSTISASLTFSEVVSAIPASSVKAALYSSSKESLSLKMTASAPESYLSELGAPELSVTVSNVVSTADTLRFELNIEGNVKDLVLVLAFGKLNAIESSSGSQAFYAPHFAIVEKVSVVSTAFDKDVAQMKGQATAAVSTATSSLMIASAPQAFVLMKIFQTLDFYVFLNILLPPNFVAFLDLMTSNIMELLPNFFENLAVNDAASEKEKFSEFGVQVNPFATLGPYFTSFVLIGGIKLIFIAIAWAIRKARKGKKSFMDPVNEALGMRFFYGLFESNNLELVLSIMVFVAEQDRLDMPVPAKVLTNSFVALLMLGILSVYGGMFWYVRRAAAKSNQETKSLDSADKKEPESPTTTTPEKKKDLLEFLVIDKDLEKCNFFQRNFSLIQLVKDIVFAGLLYIAYSSPLSILGVLSTVQIAFIVLVFKYRPFKLKRQNLQLIITQIVYGLLDVTMLVLATLPENGTEKIRYFGFGFTLIALVLSIFVVSFGFAGYEAYLTIKAAVQLLRSKYKKSQVKPADQAKDHVSLEESNLRLSENKSSISKKTQIKTMVPESGARWWSKRIAWLGIEN